MHDLKLKFEKIGDKKGINGGRKKQFKKMGDTKPK